MELAEQDKTDLIGLVSGFGDARSKARAHLLIESNANAVDYFRQMRTIGAAFTPSADQGDTQLTDEQAAELMEAILSRHRAQIVSNRRLLWLSRSIAVAAAIGIVIGTSVWLIPSKNTPFDSTAIGRVMFIPIEAALGGQNRTIKRVLHSGEHIQGKSERIAMAFSNGNRAALYSTSILETTSEERLELKIGSVVIETAHPLTLDVSAARIDIASNAAVEIDVMESGFVCKLFAGKATLTAEGQSYHLSQGEQGAWSHDDRTLAISELKFPKPKWAVQTFQTLEQETALERRGLQ